MKRSLKREVDGMGDLESPGGPPVSEAGWRDSEFSRSRLGVGGTAGVVDPVVRKEEISAKRGERFIGNGGRFTNTAVPKFDGNGC